MRKFYAIIATLGIVIFSYLYIYAVNEPAPLLKSTGEATTILISKITKCENIPIDKRDQCILLVLKNEVKESSTTETARRFIAASSKDKFVARNCHTIAHLFGRWAWETDSEASYIKGIDGCSFGYYHGLLEKLASESFEKMLFLSKEICVTASSRVELGGCIHGVGHAVAMTGESTTRFSELCNRVTDQKEMVQECFRGAIMMWSELNPGTKAADIADLCSKFSDEFAGKCIDGLVYDIQDLEQLALIDDYCSDILAGSASDCWFSSGGAVAARIVFAGAQESLLQDVCSGNYTCLESAGYHLVAGGSQDVAYSTKVCQSLNSSDSKICIDGVVRAKNQFKNDSGFLIG
jgi:hypothetical protein